MRVETEVELELENSKEEVWWEAVKVVGDVDLEKDAVVVVEPEDFADLRQCNRWAIEDALVAKAQDIVAAENRSAALAAEVKQLAVDLCRFAAVNDNGPEADLGLAVALEAAAS